MALDFANLQDTVASALMGDAPASTAVADPPASTPEAPSTPAPEPTPSPASPTAPAPAETPAAQETPEEDDFEFPEENQQEQTTPEAQPADTTQQQKTPEDDPSNWKTEDIDKMLPRQVIDKMLQTQKGRNIYQSYQVMRELEKPVTEGGLGFRPSIEQMRDMAQDSSDFNQMAHEFQNAHVNPEYAANWTKQWFQVGEDGRPAPSSVAVAQQLAHTLDAHSPDLYRAAAIPFIHNWIEELYREAFNDQNPESRTIQLNVARIVESKFTGQDPRNIPEDQWKPGQPQPQPDQRAAQLDAKLKRIEDFEKGQQAAANNAFIARLNGGIRDLVMKDIGSALSPLAQAYAGADGKPGKAYTALQKEFHDEVVSRVNANPAQLRNYVIARDQARATGDPNDIQNAARAWQAAARPIIKQLRSEYIKDASNRKIAESEQRHQVLNEASQKRGSTSIGQPTGKEPTAASPFAPQPGESWEDVVNRSVASRLTA